MPSGKTALRPALFRGLCRGTAAFRSARRRARAAALAAALVASFSVSAEDRIGAAVAPVQVVGDGIPRPLGGLSGTAERGRALMVERAAANCLLCHALPGLAVAGNVGPSLAGVGTRLSAAQLRLRIADIERVEAHAVMPSYYRVEGLDRVATEYRGKTVLDAQQVEDLVAYLETLK
jgi:sulfur-oxidizing protein SoxX